MQTPALDVLRTKQAGVLGTLGGTIGGGLLGAALGGVHGAGEAIDASQDPSTIDHAINGQLGDAERAALLHSLATHVPSDAALGGGIGAAMGGLTGAVATAPAARPANIQPY